MSKTTANELRQASGLDVYERSVCDVGGWTFFLARRGLDKLIGHVGEGEPCGGCCADELEKVADLDGRIVCVVPVNHDRAVKLRALLPWTAPKCLGLKTSVGLGDRLGLATPGHIRAIAGKGPAAILAQQSIREMTRTQRTPDEVMDAATWGTLQEGYCDGFGSDADHLQQPEDIDVTLAAGFTMFTIDPGEQVVNEADTLDAQDLAENYAALDFATVQHQHHRVLVGISAQRPRVQHL